MISLSFAILTGDDIGGSSILSYDLYWDEGSNGVTWVVQRTYTYAGDSGLIETTIEGLSSGVTYQFKYKARNIHGESVDFSAAVGVKTLTEPHAV
jgi:hypothetical protein